MTITGAIIKEQGVTFGIIVVQQSVTASSVEADKFRAGVRRTLSEFSGIPLILASQDARGVFSYQGKPDIVSFLASVSSGRIPWRKYTYSL